MLNRMIAQMLPYMPKRLVWLFSKRYIAGEQLDDAIFVSKELNAKSILVTVDLLGEFITRIDQAVQNKNDYLDVIDRFHAEGIRGNFSLKPSSFGLLIDEERCFELVREVLVRIDSYGSFLRIDMEDSQCTDREIALYLRLKEQFPNRVGLVLQAYMKRTGSDLESMLATHHNENNRLNFRLCKGIYIESPEIAYRDYEQVRLQYLKHLRFMLEHGIYVGIATHDRFLVEGAQKLIAELNVSKDRYEFQMLYGVTPALRDSIVAAGHTMRIYVPFGQDWFGYCSRRIKENPKMATDIIKALFVRG